MSIFKAVDTIAYIHSLQSTVVQPPVTVPLISQWASLQALYPAPRSCIRDGINDNRTIGVKYRLSGRCEIICACGNKKGIDESAMRLIAFKAVVACTYKLADVYLFTCAPTCLLHMEQLILGHEQQQGLSFQPFCQESGINRAR